MSDLSRPTFSTDTPDDALVPPDDFGASVIKEFERRDTTTIAGSDGEAVAAAPVEPAADEVDDTEDPASPVPSGSAAEAPGDAPDAASEGVEDDGAAPASEAPAPAPEAGALDEGDAAAEAPEAPEPEPSTTTSAGYTWAVADPAAEGGSRSITFTDEEVQRSLSLSAWAENLPDETRVAIGALEAGQAVAIPRSDFDEFQAWRTQREAAGSTAASADLGDLDPDVAKVINELRGEVTQLRGQVAQPAPADPSTLNANLDATALAFDAAAQRYADDRGLSLDEVQALLGDAVNANVIPALMEQGAQLNPVTGAILRPADIGLVAQQALDFALIRNPALHERVLSGAPSPAAATPPATPASDRVVAKKARAGSLASAPSAAVTPTPRNPSTLTSQETVDAIAKELESALAGS